MDKAKKILMIISLSGIGIACLMLILAVFQIPIFKGVPLRILLIVATIAVACGISINELSVIKRKKVLGYIGLGLLGLSALFAIVIFCSKLFEMDSIFNRITGIISVTSILFVALISIYSKLNKSLLALQIVTYAFLILLDVLLSLLIGGVDLFNIKGMTEVFAVTCIATVGLLIASSVVSSRKKRAEVQQDAPLAKAKAQPEFESLKQENLELKKRVAELEEQLRAFENSSPKTDDKV